MGLPYRLVKAASIAQGGLSGKPPSLLLVPGGPARLKAEALGAGGGAAVRAYVEQGGHYLGFCGGAGFALSDGGGLRLCPWKRSSYSNRLQHLISGHIHAKLPGGHPLCPPGRDELPLPVWWPGRFAPGTNDGVEKLAVYLRPANDVWLADLPLDSLPPDTLSSWEDMYGVRFRPNELCGQPCLVHGPFGRGSYTLSYSHLETPDSPAANDWLAHLLSVLTGLRAERGHCPAWDPAGQPAHWDDPGLNRARARLERLFRIALEHRLLFTRTPWLWGWRAGIPGSAMNNLFAALCTAQGLIPDNRALALRKAGRERFDRTMDFFCKGAEQYLLAERLASTLASTLPDAVDRRALNMQREALFGTPMEGGGLYEELTSVLNELIFLACEDGAVTPTIRNGSNSPKTGNLPGLPSLSVP
jgi:hypothetical protein